MVLLTPFQIEETVEAEGVVRLAVAGELDLSARSAVEYRLHDLASRRVPVRLDLSRLEFIDASGLRVLIRAFTEARRRASRLDLDPLLPPHVSRLLAVADFEFLY
jgi:anti-anti-sigma factor